jgi:hypothetical protein
LPRAEGVTEAFLKECEVSLQRNSELVEVGFGRNVLGSPLSAVASLVEAIEREGDVYPLAPGEIITTGTMTKAYPVDVGERWGTRFERNEFPALTIECAWSSDVQHRTEALRTARPPTGSARPRGRPSRTAASEVPIDTTAPGGGQA